MIKVYESYFFGNILLYSSVLCAISSLFGKSDKFERVSLILFSTCLLGFALVSFHDTDTDNLEGPVITISMDGFRDTRLQPETIPWDSIYNVETYFGSPRSKKYLKMVIKSKSNDGSSFTYYPVVDRVDIEVDDLYTDICLYYRKCK